MAFIVVSTFFKTNNENVLLKGRGDCLMSMNFVRLKKESLFDTSQEIGRSYLLELDVDRLLAPIYEGAGLISPKPSYGGWEKMEIKGHSIGHYLSAVANMYQATGDLEMKNRMDYIVKTFKKLQRQDGYLSGFPSQPFDEAFTGEFHVDNFSLSHYWVPWYSIHKIYAGLVDAYLVGGNKEALEILIKLADWAYEGSISMTDDQFQRMLICEYGGMNEVMAQLFEITQNERYLFLAKRFTQDLIIDPLSSGIDDLQGRHANTQIPKVLGAAKLFEITKDVYYFNAVKFFFDTVTLNRSYVIGGNSSGEHFGPSRTEPLSREAAETCNTYNMMKLAEYLFSWTKESHYMDYYERALYNHILASQDPHTGCKMYFTSNYPGHFKVYGSKEDSFWCCTGTGMENPGRYTRQIFYKDNENLYLNLFIPSVLIREEEHLKVSVETDFPYANQVKVIFEEANQTHLNVKIRLPYWLQGELEARYQNKVYRSSGQGYLTISGIFNTGDQIEFSLPMGLHEYVSMDDPHKIAILYGPIVLAAQLGCNHFPTEDIVADHLSLMTHSSIKVPKIVTDASDVADWITVENDETLTFKTNPIAQPGGEVLMLMPFYATHHVRYTIYLNKYTSEEFANLKEEDLSREEQLFDQTVDIVKTGEQQSEIEHQFRSVDSYAGYLADVNMWWRDARGIDGLISYQMEVDPTKEMELLVSYYGLNGENIEPVIRTFDILVDDILIETERLKGTRKPEIVDISYPIKPSILETLQPDEDGKYKVTVTFKNRFADSIVGGILEVRILKLI